MKKRVGINETDVTNDVPLMLLIQAVTARFERECRRRFGREDATQEFRADERCVVLEVYPLESPLGAHCLLFQGLRAHSELQRGHAWLDLGLTPTGLHHARV